MEWSRIINKCMAKMKNKNEISIVVLLTKKKRY